MVDVYKNIKSEAIFRKRLVKINTIRVKKNQAENISLSFQFDLSYLTHSENQKKLKTKNCRQTI